MVAEDGVVMDDGVTGRLGDEIYFMTTTSSGAGTVYEWAEMWLQTEKPDFEVFVDPVTAAFTSINVAGPNSRELMGRLTEAAGAGAVDLSDEAFGYMQVRSGNVAGVPDCVIWRIGFTGELSFEVHVPAGFGLHVWEQLLAVGADLGVAPVRSRGAADHAVGEGPLHRGSGHRWSHQTADDGHGGPGKT